MTHDAIKAYALSVRAGDVPAGKYHRLACERHLRDLARVGASDFPYRFDLERAEKFFRFSRLLKHYKGEFAGRFIEFEPHQVFRKGCKYGWVHLGTGLRRFRNSYEEIPRKNGKTLELAIESLYLTFFDGEQGAEGYCAGVKRDQALIVFSDCKKLVASSGLKTKLKIQAWNIHSEKTASKLQPLSADYNSMDGLNVHCATLDEMHAYKTRGMVDVIETATGARLQPLINKITTAGDDLVSPCGDEHDYACKILDRVLVDETYFAFIAHADEGDDWTQPATAAKANPNYGVSVKPDDLAAKVVKAKGIPAAAATYQQKHLNRWINATAPCLSIDGWRAGQSTWDPAEMRGQSCYVGIDIASKIDLCACAFVFPPTLERSTWRVIARIWTPQDTLADRAHRDRAPYDVWVDQGWITAVDGKSIDSDVVRQAVLAGRTEYTILQIGFDPWHADTPIKNLQTVDGFPREQVIDVPQTYAGLSAACLRVQAMVLEAKVDARGCPVTAWAVSNTVGQRDGKDNLLFTKGKSRGRIDPVMAIANAVSLAIRKETQTQGWWSQLGA